MYDMIKSIDLLGDMNDKLYYLLKTTSPELNLEIISKLQKYKTSYNFFLQYAEKDVKAIISSLNDYEKNLSTICIINKEVSNNNSDNTNLDQYISGIAKVILLLKLVVNTYELMRKILFGTKNFLSGIFYENNIENDYQEKINAFIDNLTNISLTKIKKQQNVNIFSRSTKKEKSVKLTDNINFRRSYNLHDYSLFVNVSREDEENEEKKVHKNNNNGYFQNKRISIINEECLQDSATPNFSKQSKSTSNKNDSTFNEGERSKSSSNNNQKGNNNINNKDFEKKPSIISLSSLVFDNNSPKKIESQTQDKKNKKHNRSQSQNIISSTDITQNVNEINKENKNNKFTFNNNNNNNDSNKNKNNNDVSNDEHIGLSDFISNDDNIRKFARRKKRVNSTYIKSEKYKEILDNKNETQKKKSSIITKNEMLDEKDKHTENDASENEIRKKKRTYTQKNGGVKDTKMFTDLLFIVSDLFKAGKITGEQKIQIKQLILVKSPKIKSIYIQYYENIKEGGNVFLDEILKILK